MDRSVERKQRVFIKLALGIFIGSALIVFLCWGGYRLYVTVESQRLARRAAAYAGGGELRRAALSAHQALELDPSSLAAMRELADVAERANDRSALNWRRKVIELAPDSIPDTFALANCHLRFSEVFAAEKLLEQLDENARQTAEFHATAARLAEAKKQPAQAQSHWAEAVKLAPANGSYRLQFSLVLLRTDNPAKRREGLALLEQLRAEKTERAAATRALILDGIGHRDSGQKLAEIARQLQEYPEATFSDHVLYLDILRQIRDPQFTQYLTDIEKDAASQPADLTALLSWMNANAMSLLAIDFARTLPDDVVNAWPVPSAIAEAYGKLSDWPELENWLKDKNWGQFDFLRHAYLSLALREVGRPVIADREWILAQKGASSQTQFLQVLSRAVSDWGWKRESMELLWLLTKHPETRLEALDALYRTYTTTADTLGLYRVLIRLSELLPEDSRIQNNLAQLRLLLNADVERTQKLAAKLYAKEPSNPAYASTYAFALYRKGATGEALKVMNGLTENQLRDPPLATYYGVLLAAVGQGEKAREFLKLAASAKLLPEERALIAKAEDALKP